MDGILYSVVQNIICIYLKRDIFDKISFSDAQDNTSSSNTEGEDKTTKLKRQLTRGSSEKLMLVNRFKKHSGKWWLFHIFHFIKLKHNSYSNSLEQSPDRGSWRPRLSLRRKSCSLDETVSKSEKYWVNVTLLPVYLPQQSGVWPEN